MAVAGMLAVLYAVAIAAAVFLGSEWWHWLLVLALPAIVAASMYLFAYLINERRSQ